MIVAIHPDDYGPNDASSPRWTQLLQARGIEVRPVNVYHADILDQVAGCQGFMWRWAHFRGMHRVARRLLPVLEHQLGLTVYPDWNTAWHYDDKLAQAYLLKAAGIPIPQTWPWFDDQAAHAWADQASYPVVLKLATGAGSTNVKLIRTAGEAHRWINRLFYKGALTLDEQAFAPPGWGQRLRLAASVLRTGAPPPTAPPEREPQQGYALFQEFLPDNPHDTRVTVIGRRAFGFRRFNREHDFRASGSGKLDFDVQQVDPAFIRLAFRTAAKLGAQSCAIDGLYRQKEPVVGEVSYTYLSGAIAKCPGHWELEGSPDDGKLVWRAGSMWPEEAQIEDFVARLESRHGARA